MQDTRELRRSLADLLDGKITQAAFQQAFPARLARHFGVAKDKETTISRSSPLLMPYIPASTTGAPPRDRGASSEVVSDLRAAGVLFQEMGQHAPLMKYKFPVPELPMPAQRALMDRRLRPDLPPLYALVDPEFASSPYENPDLKISIVHYYLFWFAYVAVCRRAPPTATLTRSSARDAISGSSSPSSSVDVYTTLFSDYLKNFLPLSSAGSSRRDAVVSPVVFVAIFAEFWLNQDFYNPGSNPQITASAYSQERLEYLAPLVYRFVNHVMQFAFPRDAARPAVSVMAVLQKPLYNFLRLNFNHFSLNSPHMRYIVDTWLVLCMPWKLPERAPASKTAAVASHLDFIAEFFPFYSVIISDFFASASKVDWSGECSVATSRIVSVTDFLETPELLNEIKNLEQQFFREYYASQRANPSQAQTQLPQTLIFTIQSIEFYERSVSHYPAMYGPQQSRGKLPNAASFSGAVSLRTEIQQAVGRVAFHLQQLGQSAKWKNKDKKGNSILSRYPLSLLGMSKPQRTQPDIVAVGERLLRLFQLESIISSIAAQGRLDSSTLSRNQDGTLTPTAARMLAEGQMVMTVDDTLALIRSIPKEPQTGFQRDLRAYTFESSLALKAAALLEEYIYLGFGEPINLRFLAAYQNILFFIFVGLLLTSFTGSHQTTLLLFALVALVVFRRVFFSPILRAANLFFGFPTVEPLKTRLNLAQTYGDHFSTYFPVPVLNLSGSRELEQLSQLDAESLRRLPHTSARRALNPFPFMDLRITGLSAGHFNTLQQLVTRTLQEGVHGLFQNASRAHPIDLVDQCRLLVAAMMCRTLVGCQDDTLLSPLVFAIAGFMRASFSLRTTSRAIAYRNTIVQRLEAELRARQALGFHEEREDLLGLLTSQNEPDAVTGEVLRLLAASESLSAQLAGFLYVLAKHPEGQHLRQRLTSLPPDSADMHTELVGVSLELQRMFPSASGIWYRTTHTTFLGPSRVPAGRRIFVDLLATNYSPATYHDPHMFEPMRWVGASQELHNGLALFSEAQAQFRDEFFFSLPEFAHMIISVSPSAGLCMRADSFVPVFCS
eukprot:TRINITY_DN4198_c0_g1_i4.p1 TRINITY_DN4198_c0_g1~~TRINITY_DN4198_c0_g1_i4.p1  ORF type:complete len:1064 (-),score=204.66 TRINITY_DN4198_c0_g1_i4:9-3200(-)